MYVSTFTDLMDLHGTLMNTPSATGLLTDSSVEDSLRKLNSSFHEQSSYIREKGLFNNPLYVCRLKDIYQQMFDIIFSFSMEDKLKSLLDIYLELYPKEREQILLFQQQYTFQDPQDKTILVQGDVQSGKTSMMILTAFIYLIYDRDVVFLFRNKTDDKKQFVNRFNGFVEKLREKNYHNQNFMVVDRRDKIPNHACVFVDIYSKSNVHAILQKVQRRSPENSVLYIDEADIRDDTRDTEFKQLVDCIGTKLFVSATVQDILVSKWNVRGADVIPLLQSDKYRGIEDTQFIEMIEDEHGRVDIQSAIHQVITEEWNYALHPKILLLSMDRTVQMINKTHKELIRNHICVDEDLTLPLIEPLENPCILSYTGSGITIFSEHITLQDMKEAFGKCKQVGRQTFKVRVQIKDVLKWLSENGGRAVYPTIIIIAGDMASRGINFACHSERVDNRWHLTHQIGVKSKNASCATLNQFMRIFGNHGDDIPLKFYSTKDVWTRIQKSYTLSKELVKTIRGETQFSHEQFVELNTKEICKQLPIRKDTLPKKFIVKQKLKDAFKVVTSGVSLSDCITDEEEKKVNEEDISEGDGWLVYRSSNSQRQIYDTVERIILEQQWINRWIKRSEIDRYIDKRTWDLRDLFAMQSSIRIGNTRIQYRKRNNRVEYKLIS